MKKLILTFFIVSFLTGVFGQSKPKGTFVGLEQMKGYSDPSNPKHIWYHLSVLTFKGDSVFLEQSPVAIYKTDTIFSASDGGFYSYAGTIEQYEGKPFINLKLKSCDYCPRQIKKFKPPKIVKDEDTTQITINDNATAEDTSKIENEYPNRENKVMVLQPTKSNDLIMVDKNIYRRQKRK